MTTIESGGRIVERSPYLEGSEAYVFDAARVDDGPVCRLPIPQRVPTGYHTEWVSAADLERQAR